MAPPTRRRPARPSILTKRGADALVRVERLMDDATRALAARGEIDQSLGRDTHPPPGDLRIRV